MTHAGGRSRHRAEFLRQLDAHPDAAKIRWKAASDVSRGIRVAIDIHHECGRARGVQADRGSKHLRAPHPISRHLLLDRHHGANCGVVVVEQTGRRCSGAAKRDEEGSKSRQAFAQGGRNDLNIGRDMSMISGFLAT